MLLDIATKQPGQTDVRPLLRVLAQSTVFEKELEAMFEQKPSNNDDDNNNKSNNSGTEEARNVQDSRLSTAIDIASDADIGENDAELDLLLLPFHNALSGVFEPHLPVVVQAQQKHLEQMVTELTTKEAKEELVRS